MPTAANIVLADAQATPVNHTFIPLGPDAQGVFWFEDQSQNTPLGYWRISVQLVRPSAVAAGVSAKDRVSRVKVQMHQPTLETLGTNDAGMTPAPQVAYIERGLVEFILPDRGTLQNRKDIRKMLGNLILNEATFATVVEQLQPYR